MITLPDDPESLLAPLDAAVSGLRARLSPAPVPPPVIAPKKIIAGGLTYLRSFRLPASQSNGESFAFGGGPPLALDVKTQTLLIAARSGAVAEITIPESGFAQYVQGFADPSEGAILNTFGQHNADGSITKLAGLTGLVVLEDGRLLCNALTYYDSGLPQQVSHFTRPRDLADRGHVSPLVSVGQPQMTGYVAGHMAPIPPEWQARLKGTYVSGTFGNPIVSRESLGPALFSFIPSLNPMSSTSLVYYPSDHPTLGSYGNGPANPAYNMAAKADGVVLVDGSALFFGRSGIGEQLYGAGTGDKALVGTIESGSDRYVYDPTNGSKGTHAWPYVYQVWAYALSDFADVASGLKKPWNIVPYDIWTLPMPTTLDPACTGLGGAAFDPVARLLYVPQLRVDVDGYEYRALVHVFQIA